MSRLQIVIAVGLFLIVGLFGWQTYLEKSAQKNRSDERGVPAEVRAGLKKHQEAAAKAKAKAAADAKAKAAAAEKPADSAETKETPKAPTPVKTNAVPDKTDAQKSAPKK